MPDHATSLPKLIDKRAALLKAGNGWQNLTDAECEKMMARLVSVQNAIVASDFPDDSARLNALAILIDSDDQPNFADNFKNRLFGALRTKHPSRAT